jgi:hypothetical protein
MSEILTVYPSTLIWSTIRPISKNICAIGTLSVSKFVILMQGQCDRIVYLLVGY